MQSNYEKWSENMQHTLIFGNYNVQIKCCNHKLVYFELARMIIPGIYGYKKVY